MVTNIPEKLSASLTALAYLNTAKGTAHDNSLHQPIADLMDEALR